MHFESEVFFSAAGYGKDVVSRGGTRHIGDDDVDVDGSSFVVGESLCSIGHGEAESGHRGVCENEQSPQTSGNVRLNNKYIDD